MKITREKLIQQLESFGYSFRTSTLATTGNYTVKDAMWNYQDAVMHIPHVHRLVDNFPILVGDDVAGSFFLQQALGFRFPLVVLDILSTPTTQTAFTSCFCFVLIIENRCERVSDTATRVATDYHIGAPRFFRWCTPLIAWVLRRNYQELTSTDIPMRERRGQLRRWNYEICSDREPLTYRRTLNVNLANIQPTNHTFTPVTLDLPKAVASGQTLLIGESDHLGLRLERTAEEIRFYARMCPHEGAALDHVPCSGTSVICPWHGRVLNPIARLHLGKDSAVTTQYHHITLQGDKVHITKALE